MNLAKTFVTQIQNIDTQLSGGKAVRLGVWFFLAPLFFFFTWVSFIDSSGLDAWQLFVIDATSLAIAFATYAVTRPIVVNRRGRFSALVLVSWHLLYIVPSEIHKGEALGVTKEWVADAPVYWLVIPTSCVIVAVWSLIANIALNWFGQARETLGQLRSVEKQIELARARVAGQISADLQSLRVQISDALTPAIEGLRERLLLQRTASAEVLLKAAADIREFCDQEVRSLSHSISGQSEVKIQLEKPKRLNAATVIVEIFKRGDVSVDAIFAVMCILAIPYASNSAGYQAVLVVSIGLVAGYLLMRPLDKRRRILFGSRGWSSFVSGLAMYLGISILGLAILNALLPLYSSLTRFVDSLWWLLPTILLLVWLILGWVVAAGSLLASTSAELKTFNDALERKHQQLLGKAAITRERVYRLLHGSVQGRLAAVSLALTAVADGEQAAQQELMAQAIEQLRLAEVELRHAFDDQSTRMRPTRKLKDVVHSWRNLMSIQLDIDPQVVASLDGFELFGTEVVSAIQEGITNAHRHSKASSVDVKLQLDELGCVKLTIENDVTDFRAPEGAQVSDGSGLGRIAVGADSVTLERGRTRAVLTAVWRMPKAD